MYPPSEQKVARIAQLVAESRSVIKSSVSDLPEPHRGQFERGLRNVLSTETSRMTYAQIIDGFPVVSVVRDVPGWGVDFSHPVFQNNHDTLCPGAWEKMEGFYSTFDINVLDMDEKLLNAYSSTAVGSQLFKMKLTEMIAVAIHRLAVLLYNLGDLQKHEDWKRGNLQTDMLGQITALIQSPIPLCVADMAGYWAENRILGGVVVFDRGETGNECREVYFHSCRANVTSRIYALTAEQKQNLWAFLLSDDSSLHANALPILGDSNNRVRVDAEHAVSTFHVYRDKWERKVFDDWEMYVRGRAPMDPLDYPE